MNANQIRNIINNVKEQPYHTILINGAWGIGKTYEVLNSIKDKSDIYMVSLFGTKQCEDVCKDLLIKLGGNKISQKVEGKNRKGTEKLESALKNIIPITNCLMENLGIKIDLGVVSKEVVKAFCNNSEDSIIIFDDLERVNEEFSLESFLGFIEELRKNNELRIILVANILELPEKQKRIFERFNEKIVDKIYNIDGISPCVDWARMGIEESFINEYNRLHKVCNLRTIEKAQKFYQDVLGQIEIIEDAKYMCSIRLICYAIVTEDVEKIYLNQLEKEAQVKPSEDDFAKSIAYQVNKEYISKFQLRINKFYLDDINCSIELINEIYNYYISNESIKQEVIVAGYNYYIKTGEKKNFYKSDEEIKQTIDLLRAELYDNDTVISAIEKIDIIVQWMEVFETDTSEILTQFTSYIYSYIDELLVAGKDVSVDLFSMNIESNTVKKMVLEIEDKLPMLKIERTIDRIMRYIEADDYDVAYECIEKLEQYVSVYNKRVEKTIIKLLDNRILPFGSIEPIHWRYLHRVYKLCSNEKYGSREDVVSFTAIAIEQNRGDNVFKYRMETLREKYLAVE